ncbi:MAG: sulfite exporter TauE/SafE family protein [Bacteroidia bacterium]|nr:sulfite exporter TauE/SafE family protein [Bacteroidia bacterium]
MEELLRDLTPWKLAALLLGGVLSGMINTLAGSGSLITLPLFMFICGLPAPIANGTSRVGILLQNAVGLLIYRKQGRIITPEARRVLLPVLAGSVAGASIAVTLDERIMNYCIGGLMLFMLAVLLMRPERWIREGQPDLAKLRHPATVAAFVAIGLYGGFIQAGVGVFLLAGLVLAAGFSLSGANSLKLLVVGALNVPAFFIFAFNHQIHWVFGLILASSQGLGAYLAIQMQERVPNANLWTYRLLIVMVAASFIRYLIEWF